MTLGAQVPDLVIFNFFFLFECRFGSLSAGFGILSAGFGVFSAGFGFF